MAAILEFPAWRARASPPAGTEYPARIVIFPGVRIERVDADAPARGVGLGTDDVARNRVSVEQELQA